MLYKAKRNVAVIIGSLRPDGFSARLAKALVRIAPPTMSFSIVEIGNLPHYDPELEERLPPAVVAFRAEVAKADAILFVSPEYNRSIPGVLKNALNVGSRPYGENVFAGKPVAIATQSPGAIGGFGANHALRQVLVFLDMPTLAQPEVYLANSATVLGESGETLDDGATSFLRGLMMSFDSWIDRFIEVPVAA